MTFQTAQQIRITTIPGTPYIGLTDDANLTPSAIAAGSITLETSIANLPCVKALGANDVVLDVGGLIGDTALIFAENGAKVHAFEPQVDAFICMAFNTKDKPRIKCYNIAVGNGETVALNQNPIDGNSGTRTVSTSGDGIKAFKIDEMEFKLVTFGKIDVEGKELSVLNGAIETIQKFKPKLLIEIYHSMLEAQGASAEQIYDLLTRLGYKWEVVIGTIDEPRFDILAIWTGE